MRWIVLRTIPAQVPTTHVDSEVDSGPPKIAVVTHQANDAHAQVARTLVARFGMEAKALSDPDPARIAMAVRESHALVVVGSPSEEVLGSTAVAEAIASMLPIVALCAGAPPTRLPPGISFALDADDGPDHLAVALRALVARQRDVRLLQLDAATAMRFSGGLRREMETLHGELQLAASVQQEFLPRTLPTLGGMSSAALWRPAAFVSGDIYNGVRIDEHHLGLFVTDAVGHGMPAALLTLVIARSLQVKEIGEDSYRVLPPSESLVRINEEMLQRSTRMTRFATAIYAVIDTRTHALSVSSAGHLPLLHARRGGLFEPVETHGGLLGVFKDEHFSQANIQLQPGDKVLLYSDGFEQAFPEQGQAASSPRLPNRRYLQVFNEFASLDDPQAFVDAITGRLEEERNVFPLVDDVTLLCSAWRP